MKRPYVVAMLLAVLTIAGCGKSPPPEPVYSHAKDAIKIRIKSDPLLNTNQNSPHTLMMCVYQFQNKSMFEQLASNEDGLYQLLDCRPYNDSVTVVKRFIVHPDQELTFIMDRMEKTRGVGIVAGYYTLDKSRMTRQFDIPFTIVSKKEARVDPLDLFLNLGAQQIVGADVK